MSVKQFFFTIDVDYVRGAEVGLQRLFDLCERIQLRPTLFVTGMFAVDYPELISEAQKRGYMLGTHGWLHDGTENFATSSYKDQKRWIRLSTEAVEKVTGERPVAFRAPNLWINETTLKVLEEEGYCFDSSVPARRFDLGYGQVNKPRYFWAPLTPYHPDPHHLARQGNSPILEVAPSAFFVPLNMTALRMLGLGTVKWAIHRLMKRTHTLIFYLHPQEFVEFEHLEYSTPQPKRYREGIGPKNLTLVTDLVEYILGLEYKSHYISEVSV